MFARYELCGFKYDLLNGKQTQPCQITVVTELVEYETGTVLAKRSRACPSQNHKSVVTENDVSDRELQEQAVAKLATMTFPPRPLPKNAAAPRAARPRNM